MSVIKIIPDVLGSGAAEEVLTDEGLTETVYRRTFGVLCSSPADGEITVLRAPGMVQLGASYARGSEGDATAKCRKRSPTRDGENPCYWLVDLEYGPLPMPEDGNPDDGGGGGDPDRPVLEVRVGTFQKMKVCDKDIFGNPVCNSVTELFSPLPEIEAHGMVVLIRRLEPDAGRVTISKWIHAINNADFMGVAKYQAELYEARGTRGVRDNRALYWETEYELHFDKDGFLVHVQDRGLYKWKKPEYASTAQGKLPDGVTFEEACERILDGNKCPVVEPVLLDGHGSPLQGSQPPYYHDFHLRKEMDLNGLRLPALSLEL